jgi:hypothetical protein
LTELDNESAISRTASLSRLFLNEELPREKKPQPEMPVSASSVWAPVDEIVCEILERIQEQFGLTSNLLKMARKNFNNRAKLDFSSSEGSKNNNAKRRKIKN